MAKKRSSTGGRTAGSKASAAASKTTKESADASSDVSSRHVVERLHIWQIQAVRDLLFVGAVFLLIWIGYALRTVTVPLLLALMLAYLIEPIVQRLTSHNGITRTRAVAGILTLGGLIVLMIALLITPILIGQSARLYSYVSSDVATEQEPNLRFHLAKVGKDAPAVFHDFIRAAIDVLPGDAELELETLTDDLTPGEHDESDSSETETGASEDDTTESETDPPIEGGTSIAADVDDEDAALRELIASEVATQLELAGGDDEENKGALIDALRSNVSMIVSFVSGMVGLAVALFLIPFYFFFFSIWYPDVLQFLGRMIPQKSKPQVTELLKKMDYVVAGFVRGRIVISLIMGVLLAIGWQICGVPYALPVGMMIGILCAVPYLGGIGVPLAVGLLLVKQMGLPEGSEPLAWYWVILWPTVVFVAVQTFEGYVLTPMIAGKVTNLDPVTIIVAVLAGGSVLGVYGMLLAIPLTACLKIMTTEVLLPKVEQWTRGEVADPLPFD